MKEVMTFGVNEMSLLLGRGVILDWILIARISHSSAQLKPCVQIRICLHEVFCWPVHAHVYSPLKKGLTV